MLVSSAGTGDTKLFDLESLMLIRRDKVCLKVALIGLPRFNLECLQALRDVVFARKAVKAQEKDEPQDIVRTVV